MKNMTCGYESAMEGQYEWGGCKCSGIVKIVGIT